MSGVGGWEDQTPICLLLLRWHGEWASDTQAAARGGFWNLWEESGGGVHSTREGPTKGW